jgi:hypothetical protein
VLAKHAAVLRELGVEMSPDLVKRTLERVKRLREQSLPPKGYADAVASHYRHYYSLGLSEERIVELALEAHSKRAAS